MTAFGVLPASSLGDGTLAKVSTADETRAAEIDGTALLLGQDPALKPLLSRLADLAGGRDDLRTQEAGILAGLWFASPRA